jgi:hypothetical protein
LAPAVRIYRKPKDRARRFAGGNARLHDVPAEQEQENYMEHQNASGTVEERVAKLERIVVYQQALIDRLGMAAMGHQTAIETIGDILGATQKPKRSAVPVNTLN